MTRVPDAVSVLACALAVACGEGPPRPACAADAGTLTSLGTFSQAWLNGNPNNASGLDASDLPELAALGAANDMLPMTPRIQAVWNAHTPLAGGNEVTVRGWGFGTMPDVFVGTTQVTPTTASDTEITFDTPAFSLGGEYDLRLRVGIGPLPERMPPDVFVLRPFKPAERKALEEVVERAADAATDWIDGATVETLMNRYNVK